MYYSISGRHFLQRHPNLSIKPGSPRITIRQSPLSEPRTPTKARPYPYRTLWRARKVLSIVLRDRQAVPSEHWLKLPFDVPQRCEAGTGLTRCSYLKKDWLSVLVVILLIGSSPKCTGSSGLHCSIVELTWQSGSRFKHSIGLIPL